MSCNVFVCLESVSHTSTHMSYTYLCATYTHTHTLRDTLTLRTMCAVVAVLHPSAYHKCCRQRNHTIKSILKSAVVAWIIYLKRTQHIHRYTHTLTHTHRRTAVKCHQAVGNMVA